MMRIIRAVLSILLLLSVFLYQAEWACPMMIHATGSAAEITETGLPNKPEEEIFEESAVTGDGDAYMGSGDTDVNEEAEAAGGDQYGEGTLAGDGSSEGQNVTCDNGLPTVETQPLQEREEQATEEAEQSEDTVYDEAQLADWCEEHRAGGGRVALGDVVTLTGTILLYACENIVIDTGPYGLVYDGGGIYLFGSEEFAVTGEGVDYPVLDVYDTGGFNGGWNSYTQSMRITATGRDGMGGIALRVRQDDGIGMYAEGVSYEGQIRSYGECAVGLYLDVPLDVYCYNIEVEGANSTAVYAALGANLYYCKLKAGGDGSAAVSGGGDILLDTCTASPTPNDDVQVVRYHIVGIISGRFYLPIEQDYPLFLFGGYTFLLSNETGSSTVASSFYIQWNDLNSVDTGELGIHVVQGRLTPPFQGLGIEGDFSVELIIEVCDPDLPMIYELTFINFQNDSDSPNEKYVYINYWNSFERDDEDMILWRSDDLGETWYNFTDFPDVDWWYRGMVCFYYGEITDPITLQLERVGVGVSNMITLYAIDGIVMVNDDGGDRTGVDRVVVDGNSESGSGGFASTNRNGSGSRRNTGFVDKSSDINQTVAGSNAVGGATQAESEPLGAQSGDTLPSENTDVALLIEMPLATEPVKADLSTSAGLKAGTQTDPADILDDEDEAYTATLYPKPEAETALRISRPASESQIDMRAWIILATIGVVLLAAAFIWSRRRKIME